MLNTLESLFKLARERKNNPVDGSYTNKLLSDKSLSKEKVLEEINELIEAVEKNSNKIENSYVSDSTMKIKAIKENYSLSLLLSMGQSRLEKKLES